MYFEKYFYNFMHANHPEMLDRYIPIFWTENQISKWNKEARQAAVNTLPADKKYFTVVQHADGIKHTRLSNTTVFGMGERCDIPLPLTYENPELFKQYANRAKTIFCSFVGASTHPCRIAACKELNGKPNVVLSVRGWTNKIPSENQKQFIEIMSKSRFSLAPRGYGKTSFRLYEALKLGSIPVYIYDELLLPYTELLDWNKMAVLIHIRDIPTMYEKLRNISDDEVVSMLLYYEQHKHLFSYEGISKYIIDRVYKII